MGVSKYAYYIRPIDHSFSTLRAGCCTVIGLCPSRTLNGCGKCNRELMLCQPLPISLFIKCNEISQKILIFQCL